MVFNNKVDQPNTEVPTDVALEIEEVSEPALVAPTSITSSGLMWEPEDTTDADGASIRSSELAPPVEPDVPESSGVADETETQLDDQPMPRMVESKLCVEGHANRPTNFTCAECEALLPPDGELVAVLDPVVAHLKLDDGRVVALDRDVTVGRGSAADGHIHLDGERISRQHIALRIDGWDVLVEDLGSTNGTVIVEPDGSTPVALVAGEATPLRSGAVVYLGTSSFVLD